MISLAAQTSSFDPTATVSATDRATSSLLSTSLFVLDAKGDTVPGLAENVEYNEDFTAATVTLREAQFSDGSPITAEDVAATINRHKSVQGSRIASTTNRIDTVTATDDRPWSSPSPRLTRRSKVRRDSWRSTPRQRWRMRRTTSPRRP